MPFDLSALCIPRTFPHQGKVALWNPRTHTGRNRADCPAALKSVSLDCFPRRPRVFKVGAKEKFGFASRNS